MKMASRQEAGADSSQLIDRSCTHALVEFYEEECTAVVPLQRIIDKSFEAGDKVTVIWNNGKAYPAVFLLSGSKQQCHSEEDRIMEEEADADSDIDDSCTHALVDFVEEGCTAVVPLQRIIGENFKAGDKVTVIWNNRKEYSAVFLRSGSKEQCHREEDRLIAEEADQFDNYCENDLENSEKSLVKEDCEECIESEEDISNKHKRSDDVDKRDNKPQRKRRKLVDDKCGKLNYNKDGSKGSKTKKRSSKDGNKENKKKDDNEEFIVRVGRIPLRNNPFNVSDPLHDIGNKEDNLMNDVESYSGQAIELYSSDEEGDEFYRLCAMVEQGFTATGRLNKLITIPVEDTQEHGRSDDPPIHYTGGAKEIELEKKIDALAAVVRDNDKKRETVCSEIRLDVVKINEKFEETQKTLSQILAKLINPNAVQLDGFAAPSTRVSTIPAISVATSTNSIITPANSVPTPTNSIITSANSVPAPVNSIVTHPPANSIVTHSPANSIVTHSPANSIVTPANSVPTPANSIVTPANSVPTPANSIVTHPPANSVLTPANSIVTHPPANSVPTPANSIVTHSPANSIVTPANSVPTSANSIITHPPADSVVTPTNSVITPAAANSETTSVNSTVTLASDVTTPVHFETVETSSNTISHSGMLEPTKIMSIKRKSCSRKNFSSKLVRELFDEDTRRRSNVAGKLGKLKLNPVLMDYVKSLTFQHYPVEQNEREKYEWAQCVISIDEANRRKKPKTK